MPRQPAKALVSDDVRRLLEHVRNHRHPDRDRVIVLLSFKAGLRACEIAGLDWSMVLASDNRIGSHLRIARRIAKMGSGRDIPMHKQLATSLGRLHRGEGRPRDGPVIRSERNRPMTARSIVNWFGRAYQTLELTAAAFEQRLDRWLGSWSRASHDWGDSGEQVRRQAEREARIDTSVADLTNEELALFRERCAELPNRAGLAAAAALLIYGETQARFARGVVAFALAYTVAGDHRTPYDDVAWVLRLNRLDFPGLLSAVRTEIAPLTGEGASITARMAAALALRLLGSREAQELAETISETPEHQSVSQGTPRIDPIDPVAAPPEGVAEATARLKQIDPAAIWNHMSTTAEDHDFERNKDLIIRFDPEGIAAYLDRVAGTLGTRNGRPLRQLGWHLPWLSPILSDETGSMVIARVADISADAALVPGDDQDFVLQRGVARPLCRALCAARRNARGLFAIRGV